MNQMDTLLSEWTSESQHDQRIDKNKDLLNFLGTWLYSQYQPFPEKPAFWDRLYSWLDNVSGKTEASRRKDQQALFNFLPWLLFVGEEDLIATYRAAYTGPICRWLITQANILLDDTELDNKLSIARQKTWFGSLAGLDINTFCRVNGVFGQSYRPEFRFLAEFCNIQQLASWLRTENYERIVIVEDMVGTGTQLDETKCALSELRDFPILFVPLFIAPEGYEFALTTFKRPAFSHVTCEPIFVLPHDCLVHRKASRRDSREIAEFRDVNSRHGKVVCL